MTLTEKEAQTLRVLDGDFQREVLEKLGRLEAKMDMLTGNGQPGRMKLAEDRIHALGTERLAADRDRTAGQCQHRGADQRGDCVAWALVEVAFSF